MHAAARPHQGSEIFFLQWVILTQQVTAGQSAEKTWLWSIFSKWDTHDSYTQGSRSILEEGVKEM